MSTALRSLRFVRIGIMGRALRRSMSPRILSAPWPLSATNTAGCGRLPAIPRSQPAQSETCPGVISVRIGRHAPLTRRWILVGPRSRTAKSRVQDVLPQPCARPAAEPAADQGPLAEFFGRVAPWRTGSCDPENTIQNKTMIRKFPPVRGPEGTSEALEEGPPIAGYQAARQVHLPRRDALEPWDACRRNPFCQHDLGRIGSGKSLLGHRAQPSSVLRSGKPREGQLAP